MALKFDKAKLARNLSNLRKNLAAVFFRKSGISTKTEVNFKALRTIAVGLVFIFIAVVMLMPNEQLVEFTEKIPPKAERPPDEESPATASTGAGTAQALWGPSRPSFPGMSGGGGGSQVNHNTSMILGSKNGNAKTQLRAGVRFPLRVVDKFIVSTDPVPILAELLVDAMTDSGLRLPAGTSVYGEASFQKGADRATIQFRQVSLPDGQIRPVTGIAVSKDGHPGVSGRVYSDGLKNTAGSVLTTFVGGLAAGSVETDIMGRSRGGLENGLLTAVAATAKERAQSYGEKMKAEREWIEVPSGAECDLLLSESMNLQQGGAE